MAENSPPSNAAPAEARAWDQGRVDVAPVSQRI